MKTADIRDSGALELSNPFAPAVPWFDTSSAVVYARDSGLLSDLHQELRFVRQILIAAVVELRLGTSRRKVEEISSAPRARNEASTLKVDSSRRADDASMSYEDALELAERLVVEGTKRGTLREAQQEAVAQLVAALSDRNPTAAIWLGACARLAAPEAVQHVEYCLQASASREILHAAVDAARAVVVGSARSSNIASLLATQADQLLEVEPAVGARALMGACLLDSPSGVTWLAERVQLWPAERLQPAIRVINKWMSAAALEERGRIAGVPHLCSLLVERAGILLRETTASRFALADILDLLGTMASVTRFEEVATVLVVAGSSSDIVVREGVFSAAARMGRDSPQLLVALASVPGGDALVAKFFERA